jgi:hypothetical protein
MDVLVSNNVPTLINTTRKRGEMIEKFLVGLLNKLALAYASWKNAIKPYYLGHKFISLFH